MTPLRILDLFSGTGSSSQAFTDRGHEVIHVELGDELVADLAAAGHTVIQADVFDLTAAQLVADHGPFDFAMAGPPCEKFSVMRISRNWTPPPEHAPRNPEAARAAELVAHTRRLLEQLAPRYGWVMENPVAKLRALPVVAGLDRDTISFCQYASAERGEPLRMKPTDLFGPKPYGWRPLFCGQGQPCHEAAPRGSQTGTQGIKSKADRGRWPYGLSASLADAVERRVPIAALPATEIRTVPPMHQPDLWTDGG